MLAKLLLFIIKFLFISPFTILMNEIHFSTGELVSLPEINQLSEFSQALLLAEPQVAVKLCTEKYLITHV